MRANVKAVFSGGGARRPLQHFDLRAPARHDGLAILQFKTDPARQPRIADALQLARLDRRDEARERRVVERNTPGLELHLKEGFVEDEGERRAARRRNRPHRPRRRPQSEAQRARVGREEFAQAQKRCAHAAAIVNGQERRGEAALRLDQRAVEERAQRRRPFVEADLLERARAG